MNPNKKPGKSQRKRPIAEKTLNPIPAPEFEEYLDLNDGEVKPMTLEGLRRLSNDYVAWGSREKKKDSDPEEALIPNEFHFKRGISNSMWQRWLKWSEHLRDAHEHVKMLCAIRRHHGSMKKRYDFKATSFGMYRLNHEWDEDERRDRALKMEELQKEVDSLKSLVKYVDMSRPQEQTDEEFRKEVEGTKE